MIFRRSPRDVRDPDGSVDAAITAAVTAARAAPFSDSGTLTRLIEDAALTTVDPSAARRLRDVDRTFDRRHAELSRDYERRLSLLESEPTARPVSSAADVVGVLAAITGSAVLLAGGSNGPALPLPAATGTTVALTLFALALHSLALLGAGRPGRAVSAGWSLIVVSAIAAIASGAWIVVRTRTVDQGLDATPSLLLLGAAALVLLICSVVAVRAARGRTRGVEEAVRRQRALTADYEPALAEARAVALTRADGIRTSLRADSLARIDEAAQAGVRHLKKSETYEGATFDELLSSPRFSRRYDATL